MARSKVVRQLPNILTVVRIGLVVPAAYFLWNEQWTHVLAILVVAGLTDALDGTLARRFNWISKFGEHLDPVADKVLFGVLIVIFTIKGLIPVFVTVTVLGRDLVILLGAATYRALYKHVEIAPLFISKINTCVQIVVLAVILAALVELPVFTPLADAVIDPWGYWLLVFFSVASGTVYVIKWATRARMEGKSEPEPSSVSQKR